MVTSSTASAPVVIHRIDTETLRVPIIGTVAWLGRARPGPARPGAAGLS